VREREQANARAHARVCAIDRETVSVHARERGSTRERRACERELYSTRESQRDRERASEGALVSAMWHVYIQTNIHSNKLRDIHTFIYTYIHTCIHSYIHR